VDFSSVEDGGDATSEEGLNEPSLAREGFASETYTPRGTGMVHSSIVRDDIDDGKAFDLGVGVFPDAVYPSSIVFVPLKPKPARAIESHCANAESCHLFALTTRLV
jgi:hypothetical protein